MHGRLAAPPAAAGCLEADAIAANEARGLIALADDTQGEEIAVLRDFLRSNVEAADALLAERFWSGRDVLDLVHARAWVVEQLLLLAWRRLVPFLEGVALVAVGGFGRGELHPASDVDLMVLLDDDIGDELPRREIEAFVQLLWDAGFYLGHSVRTVNQCRDESLKDIVTTTTLMESRLLVGARDLYEQMLEVTAPPGVWPAAEFFEAKYAEQKARHERYHETAYNLEPNIKEGPGGLRDIQTISWVARRHFDADHLHGLVTHEFLTDSEYHDLVGGKRFLWRVRFALHLLAGRAEDRLLFDYQRQIAERFGFEDSETSLAVEQFMQLYYRTVMRLERLNDALLQLFQEAFLNREQDEVRDLNERFRVRNGYLEPRHRDVFTERPAALMELFELLARNESLKGVTAATIRTIRNHLYLVDQNFRDDPEVNRHFLELLRQPEGIYTQLRRMNRYGVLAAYIPAFGNIVGRMQYDLFHVYTVDQHTLFVVRNLRRFAYGKYRERFPHSRKVFKRIARPELLYLAAIFHDIAKGRGGDHSELGAVDTEAFCSRLDIEPAERDMVVWLVRQHLLMSQTSQRKDLSDPVNIQAFAKAVGIPVLAAIPANDDIRELGSAVRRIGFISIDRSRSAEARRTLEAAVEVAGRTASEIEGERAELLEMRGTLDGRLQRGAVARLGRHEGADPGAEHRLPRGWPSGRHGRSELVRLPLSRRRQEPAQGPRCRAHGGAHHLFVGRIDAIEIRSQAAG